ncbi:MAG: hypothetical protein KDJ26_02450 [Alphaproteobacteria bacterium]|nr:hypothetical protein [Alphaproteobacteria bacterium]MCB9984252.1 hypothetical protein [Micavibrio sp.]
MSMKQTTTATPQERTAQSNGAAYAIAPEIAIDPNQFSTKDLNNFADGVRHLTDNYKPEDLHSLHDSMHEIAPEDLTTGEALITYGIMHNPVMEAIASNHAMDAMAFANDVMINGAQIERLQSRTQMAFASLDADDEDLTPEQRARKRERERAQDTAEALEDIHDEQLKEWQEHWDKQMHTIGGQQRSGAWITDFYNKWWSNPENQEKLREKMKAEGKTDSEIDETFEKIEERKKLWNRMRECPNAEERKRLQEQYDALGTQDVIEAEDRAAKMKDQENTKKIEASKEFDTKLLNQNSIRFSEPPSQPKKIQSAYEENKFSITASKNYGLEATSTLESDARQNPTEKIPTNHEVFSGKEPINAAGDFLKASTTSYTENVTPDLEKPTQPIQITKQDVQASMSSWGV